MGQHSSKPSRPGVPGVPGVPSAPSKTHTPILCSPPETGQSPCTQLCIQGACNGGLIDLSCPNVSFHPKIKNKKGLVNHDMRSRRLLGAVKSQMLLNPDPKLRIWTREINNGFAYLIKLRHYGYTLVYKEIDAVHRREIIHEKAIYDRLKDLQGDRIPICVGSIDVPRGGPDDTPAICLVTAWAGVSLKNNGPLPEVREALKALHQRGIKHGDLAARNVLVDPYTGKTMIIDFGRSSIILGGRLKSHYGHQTVKTMHGWPSCREFVCNQIKIEIDLACRLDSGNQVEMDVKAFHQLDRNETYKWFHEQLVGESFVATDNPRMPAPAKWDDLAGTKEFIEEMYKPE